MVRINGGSGPHNFWRGPDGFTVHQKLQIIRPNLPGSCNQNAKEDLLRLAAQRKRNRILGPAVRTLHLTLLHVVEGNGSRVSVLAHPQSCEFADILGSQKTAPLDAVAGEIRGNGFGERGESIGAVRSAFKPRRRAAAV